MSRGAVLVARNNAQIDYIKQAAFNASRIKKYLDIPVTILTDNVTVAKKLYETIFDQIIEIPNEDAYSHRKYNDGTYFRKSLEFKNNSRSLVYDLSPYDETLLLDTDYIISNDIFKKCFLQKHDFLIYDGGVELSGWRNTDEFNYISIVGPKFYWATAIFFRKTRENKIYFDLVKHIQANWSYYLNLYQITSSLLRNDFIFSIAIHIMNGFTNSNFAKPMPGKLFYSIDRDLLVDLKDDNFLMLIEKENDYGNYSPMRIKGCNLHVMNKFSLDRIIKNDN